MVAVSVTVTATMPLPLPQAVATFAHDVRALALFHPQAG